MISQKFNELVEQYAMLPPGSRVLCACSGGADSTALLHLLHQNADLYVVCAHFNHRLRGAESDRDEAFVRAMCEKLGVECICGSDDVAAYAADRHMGIEQAARELRYAFLERTAASCGYDRIATAHHAEDNAETVLLNLTRGSGLRGLSGIPPVRGNIIRPLLSATRGEILDYLAENGISFVEDSSNDRDDCARNRIRHRVLPLLQEENPAAVEHICAASALARRDEEYLNACAEHFIEKYFKDGALYAPEFLALSESVGTRVLRLTLGQLSASHIAAVYALCRSGNAHGAVGLPGRRIRLERDRLLLSDAGVARIERRPVPEGETRLEEQRLVIRRYHVGKYEEIHNSFNTFFFQCGSIRDMICVASRAPGDSVRLLGRGCTKTLKKLFSEAKLPLEERERTPVLYDASGVIAVYGFGVAERCAAREGDEAICIEIREIKETRG